MTSSRQSSLLVGILGPVLVADRSGTLSEPTGVLGKNLVVALALAGGATVSVQGLVSDLWEDAPPRQERAALQTLVSRLRASSADGILESTAGGYALTNASTSSDLGRAIALRDRAAVCARTSDHTGVEDAASQALALWRGPAGLDLGETRLAEELAARSEALARELHRLRATSRLASGAFDRAAEELEQLLAVSPLDEQLELLHLRAVAGSGRRTDAIAAFGRFRERVRDELGTNPGPELVSFHAELLRADNDAPEREQPQVRIGLRTSPNALLGRENDVDAVHALIASSRLTTIVGPGGIGKTRLAQEVARLASDVPAVIFVELAPVRSGDDLPLALASTLGIHEVGSTRIQVGERVARPDLRARIFARLAERRTLLVMDNCEHLVDAAALWIADLLESTTSLTVLATSRGPLSIGAERVYQLDSLPSESAAVASEGSGRSAPNGVQTGPAVALFIDRARSARPGVVLPTEAIVRLCERLDGLPLAIELAAARTRSMSVEEIERRLENRFALLTGGDRTAPERHRTLFAVIDWSWNLLDDRQRRLLRRLSRFPDGFSADAAQKMTDDSPYTTVIDTLDALVSQSLISVSEDPATGILRFRMLETVREFGDVALVKAGETELVRDRMYDWAADFALYVANRMDGAEQLHGFQLVGSEQDNLVAVLRSAMDSERPDVVIASFAALAYYWSLRGAHTEVLTFGREVVAATDGYTPDGDHAVLAAASYAIVSATFMYSDMRTGARALGRLRRLMRSTRIEDSRLSAMIQLLLVVGRPVEARQMIEQLVLSPDPGVACMANLISAQFEENFGDVPRALARGERAFDLAVEIGDLWSQGTAAQGLAQMHSQLAHPREALDWAAKARVSLKTLDAKGDLRQLDWIFAINLMRTDRVGEAKSTLEHLAKDDDETLGIDALDLRAIGWSGLAEIALREGDTEQGLSLYREAIGVFGERLSAPIPWLNLVTAACISAHVRADVADRRPVAHMVRDLRTRVLVTARLQKGFVDTPVLGTAIIGLAAWLLWEPASDQRSALGLELFALAALMNSRQDLPSLDRARFLDDAIAQCGRDAVDTAIAHTAALTREAGGRRAVELLESSARLWTENSSDAEVVAAHSH